MSQSVLVTNNGITQPQALEAMLAIPLESTDSGKRGQPAVSKLNGKSPAPLNQWCRYFISEQILLRLTMTPKKSSAHQRCGSFRRKKVIGATTVLEAIQRDQCSALRSTKQLLYVCGGCKLGRKVSDCAVGGVRVDSNSSV